MRRIDARPDIHNEGTQPLDQPDASRLFWRGFLYSVTGVLVFSVVLVAVAIGAYVIIALRLPKPEELHTRAASFVSTKIYDRNGQLLYEVFDPTGGKRTLVRLDQIPLSLRNATVATEDPTFYTNPAGFNPFSIARGVYQYLREGQIVSGASTITQQLVKLLFVGGDITVERKIKEAVLATEITRTYNKDTILEIYLNEIYYGNLSYGVSAAAETYFGKSVSDLTLGESALLVGIVPSPVAHDPYMYPENAKAARAAVLDLMVKHGYITTEEAEAAKAEPIKLAERKNDMKAPHFVVYVRQLLEEKYGNDVLYRGGLRVETTLDLRMQEQAEAIVSSRVAALNKLGAGNAALVSIDPTTAEIRAMVGSVDFNQKGTGQVNMAITPRQPGSSIKPLTYAAAFEKGWTPATMIMDVNTKFPDGANPDYVPKNYDDKEHGPVSVRTALACSYNIPAVKALQFIGIQSLLEMSRRLGVTTLTRPDYGLALTLGGGEVSPLEMAGAYTAFASGGVYRQPQAILRIKDANGKVIYEHNPGSGREVLDARNAYLITNILSDDNARLPTYGPNSVLNLSKPAAAKTGTTNDYKDAWTIGYTTSLVTAVWVGNNTPTPMNQVAGGMGAAPIWHDFMEKALPLMEAEGKPAQAFKRPAGIVEVEVCAVSGLKPTADCPNKRKEVFVQGTEPRDSCSVHRKVRVCKVSGKLAGEFCPANVVEDKLYESYPADGQDWAKAKNIVQPPSDKCNVHTGLANIAITLPQGNQEVSGTIEIRGSAEMPDMHYYRLDYGLGDNPQGWAFIEDHDSQGVHEGHLGTWNTRGLKAGVYTVRLQVADSGGNAQEYRVQVWVKGTAATVTPTASVAPTRTVTPTRGGTNTVAPTRTPEPSHTPRVKPTLTPTAKVQGQGDEPVETPTP